MAESFYTILTNVGLAAIANAQITQSKVDFATFVVGDSNGNYYNPTSNQANLVNEVWRGPINGITIDEKNKNWVIVEAVIPESVGGFSVREIGVLDTNGQLLAVGKVPESYKPVTAEGSLKDLYLRMILEVSNASVITLKVDPAVIFASKKYVDDKFLQIVYPVTSVNGKKGDVKLSAADVGAATAQDLVNLQKIVTQNKEEVTTHLDDNVRHVDYATASGTNAYTATIPNVKTLVEGMSIKVKFTNANTAGSTLNINGLGAKEIRKGNGNTLLSGNIKAGQILHLVYTGSNFQELGEGGSGNLKPNQALAGFTFTNDDGDQVGLGDPNLKPENIRKDTTIFGVTGALGVAHGGLRQDISLTWEQPSSTHFPSSGGSNVQTVYPLSNGDAIVVTDGGFGRITKQGVLVYFVNFHALFGSQKVKKCAIDVTGTYLAFFTESASVKSVRTYNINGSPISATNLTDVVFNWANALAVDTKGKAVYSYQTGGAGNRLVYEGLYTYENAPLSVGTEICVDKNSIVYSLAASSNSVLRIATNMTNTIIGRTDYITNLSLIGLDSQYLYVGRLDGNDMLVEKISISTSQTVATLVTARWANTGIIYYGDCRIRNNLMLIKMRVYSDVGAFNHYFIRDDLNGHNYMNTRGLILTTGGTVGAGIEKAFHIQGDEFYVTAIGGKVLALVTIKNETVL